MKIAAGLTYLVTFFIICFFAYDGYTLRTILNKSKKHTTLRNFAARLLILLSIITFLVSSAYFYKLTETFN